MAPTHPDEVRFRRAWFAAHARRYEAETEYREKSEADDVLFAESGPEVLEILERFGRLGDNTPRTSPTG